MLVAEEQGEEQLQVEMRNKRGREWKRKGGVYLCFPITPRTRELGESPQADLLLCDWACLCGGMGRASYFGGLTNELSCTSEMARSFGFIVLFTSNETLSPIFSFCNPFFYSLIPLLFCFFL